jgi:hypothetical protein
MFQEVASCLENFPMPTKFCAYLALLMFALPVLTIAEDEGESLEFRDETYELAYVKETKSGKFHEILNEYIPEEEELKEWSSMIAVRQYPGRTDFEQLAGTVVKVLKQQNPDAPSALHTSPDGKRTMVDFITWDLKQEIVEFNVFIYELGPGGTSVVAQQYALRTYGQEEGLKFLKELKPLRPKILEAVGKFKFPPVTTEQPTEAEAE